MTTDPVRTRRAAPLGLLLGVAVALLTATAATPSRADATLRWKFTKGQKFNYRVSQKIKTKMGLPNGGQVESMMDQEMDILWDVQDVDAAGTASILQSMGRIKMTMKGPGTEVSFDTDDPKDPEGPLAPMAKVFSALKTSRFKIKMNSLGKITDVAIPAELVESFKSMGPMAGPLGTEEGLKNITSQGTLLLPDGPIAVGKTWNDTKAIAMPFGTMEMALAYTYKGRESADEAIGVVVKSSIKPKAGTPIAITIGDQDTNGTYAFDNNLGLLKSSKLLQKMTMNISANGQEMTQDVEGTTTMEMAKARGVSAP